MLRKFNNIVTTSYISYISIKTIILKFLHVYSDNASQKIKFSSYSLFYTQACNEWRSPLPRRSVWATQLRTNVATVASRWRHCDDLADPAIEPQTSRTDRVGLATELIGRHNAIQVCSKIISLAITVLNNLCKN